MKIIFVWNGVRTFIRCIHLFTVCYNISIVYFSVSFQNKRSLSSNTMVFGVICVYPGQYCTLGKPRGIYFYRIVLEALGILFSSLSLSGWSTNTVLRSEVYAEDMAFSQVIIFPGLYYLCGPGYLSW